MITFPEISKPSYPLKIELENNSLMSKFEDGAVQSRKKFTRSRRTFTVNWKGLPNYEYLILDNFIRNIVNYSAETFLWVNPATYRSNDMYSPFEEETIEVRITNVGGAEMDVLDRWNIELTLQEV